jgi:hypothetical protein
VSLPELQLPKLQILLQRMQMTKLPLSPPRHQELLASADQVEQVTAEQALHPLIKPQLHELGPRELNKASRYLMKTLNTLQLLKLGTCQLNKPSFPLNHHKSVTQYVRTMKPSPLYKSATTTSPSTKSAQLPTSRTATSPSRSWHATRLGGGTDYDAPSSSSATSKHMKQMTSPNTTKHFKKTSQYTQ